MRWRLLRWFRRSFRRPVPGGGSRPRTGWSGWFAAAAVGLVVGTFLIVEANMNTTILDISKVEARQMAVNVFSQEIERTIGSNAKNVFHITSQGTMSFVNIDSAALDREATVATIAIEKGLKRLPNDTIEIPLGQALGSKLLAAYGPNVPVTLIPYGAVTINFTETMRQAGINQTFVEVDLQTDTQVQIIVPLVSDTIHLKASVPLAQELVVGNVPQTYVNTTRDLKTLSVPIGTQTIP